MSLGAVLNLKEFGEGLLKFEQQVKERLRGGTVALARDTFRSLVLRTPFRTGSAKASWRLSLNGVEQGVTILAWGGTAAAAEAAAFAQLAELSRYDPFKHEIVLSNSLHYIDDLESGSSRKAPRGFLRVTFMIAARTGDRYFADGPRQRGV